MFTQFLKRSRRALAAVTATAVLAGSALVGVAAPASAVAPPEVSVAVKSADVATGLTVTVTGSQFLDMAGLYVALIEKGTENAILATDPNAQYIHGAGLVDGAFSQDVTLETARLDKTKQYEVVSWKQGTMPSSGGEVYTRNDVTVTAAQWNAIFPPAVVTPSVAASVKSADVATGLTVSVAGSNFDTLPKTSAGKDAVGVYVAVVDAAIADLAVTSDNVAGVNFLYGAAQIRGGAFTSDVVVPVAELDASKSYKVVVWAAHGDVIASTLLASESLVVTAAQWNAIFPPAVVTPSVAASVKSADVATGLTVSVAGSNFDTLPKTSAGKDAVGVYVAVVDAAIADLAVTSDNVAGVNFLYGAAQIRGGAFTSDVVVPVAELDASKSYKVVVWAAHGDVIASTLLASESLVVTAAQWNAIFPPAVVTPSVAASVKSADVATGLTVSVAGSNFDTLPKTSAGKDAVGVYVAVVDAAIADLAVTSDNVAGVNFLYGAAQIRGGAFTSDVVVPVAELDASKSYKVVVWAAHGDVIASTLLASESLVVTAAQWNAIFPPAVVTPSVAASVKSADVATGLTVSVAGSNFDTLPKTSAGKDAVGVYVAVVDAAIADLAVTSDNVAGVNFLYGAAQIRGGAFTSDVVVPVAELDASKSYKVVVWAAHGDVIASTLLASESLVVTAAQWNAIFPGTLVPTQPVVKVGALEWGVKESFRTYIESPTADGDVVLDGAALNATGNAYFFPQTDNGFDGTKGTVKFSGSVRFTGHHGALDTKFANPYVVVNGSKGELFATVSALQMSDPSKKVSNTVLKIADLTFKAPVKNADGSFTLATTSVLLAPSGVQAFSGFYKTGAALDNLSFVAGANNGSLGTGTDTSSTPDASAQINDNSVKPGDLVTLIGRGFKPNETGISLRVHSTPRVLLQNLVADANGVVTAQVAIPANLEAGTHTFVFVNADNTTRAAVKFQVLSTTAITPIEGGDESTDADDVAGTDESNSVKEDTKQEDKCVARSVSGASLSWGVKGTYVTYVTGGIAKGEIVTSGVSQSGRIFNWSGGSGKYNTAAGMGSISFPGSIQFKGHDGAMDTKLSNIRVQISGNKGYLYANVNAKGYTNDGIVKNGALIGTINLAGAKSVSGSTLSISGASVTLAAEGAEAFGGFYEAGSVIDPISLTAQLGANVDCDTASGSGLANTGADNVQSGAAAAIFFVLAGAVALVASRRKMAVKA